MQIPDTVNAKQMAVFTFVTQTGVGVITLPAILANEVGHDGWISVLITGILTIGLSAVVVLYLKRYSDKAIYDINKLLYGKIAGTVINALLTVYLLMAVVGGARLFSLFLRITLLPTTPPIILLPAMVLPSFYMVWYGLRTVCRFLNITLFSYAAVIIFFIIIYQEYRLSFLMPVAQTDLLSMMGSIRTTFFAFIGFELIVFFYPQITDKGNVMKYHVSASIFSTVFYLIIVAGTTAVFGENFLKIQTLPLFNVTRIYNAPVLERVDLYLMTAWFIAIGCSMRSYIMASWQSLMNVYKLKKTRISYVLFFAAFLLLSRVPRDMNEAIMFLDILNYVGIGVTIFIIISYLLSFIRKSGVNGQKAVKGGKQK